MKIKRLLYTKNGWFSFGKICFGASVDKWNSKPWYKTLTSSILLQREAFVILCSGLCFGSRRSWFIDKYGFRLRHEDFSDVQPYTKSVLIFKRTLAVLDFQEGRSRGETSFWIPWLIINQDPDIAMGNRKCCKSIIKTTIVLQENYSELQHFCASLSIGQSKQQWPTKRDDFFSTLHIGIVHGVRKLAN